MFGFLSAPCSSCSSKEHSVYRAHFCGLCNRLRHDYGLHTRFLVNRDATFLSLLGNGLQESPTTPVSNTCCNPLGKPRLVVQERDAVSYAAAVTICGLKAKLDDEVEDRRAGPTRFALKGLRGLNASSFSKEDDVLRSQGFPLSEVQEALAEQSVIELHASASNSLELEAVSAPTSFTFGKILAHASGQAHGTLEAMGQSLGRLIYTLDAFVDQAKDRRDHQFNPFLLQPVLVEQLPTLFERDLEVISDGVHSLSLSGYRDVLDIILGKNLRNTCFSMLEGPGPVPLEGPRKKQSKKKRRSCCEDCCDGCTWCDVIYCCDCDPDCCDAGCCDAGCCDCDVCCCDCT